MMTTTPRTMPHHAPPCHTMQSRLSVEVAKLTSGKGGSSDLAGTSHVANSEAFLHADSSDFDATRTSLAGYLNQVS